MSIRSDCRSGCLHAVIITLIMLSPVPAHAALLERLGGQAYYDSTINVTWLRDANLAVSEQFGLSLSPNYDPTGPLSIGNTGKMVWDTAQAWIAGMNKANYLGFSDWRLPTMIDTGAPGCDWGFNGTDCGENVQTYSNGVTYSEMAYLYYVTLGNIAYTDTNGNAPQAGYGLKNSGPFVNIDTQGMYWFGLEYAPSPADFVWAFHMGIGHQGNSFAYGLDKNLGFSAWAVRTGDVAAVPVPGALLLLSSALTCTVSAARRRRLS